MTKRQLRKQLKEFSHKTEATTTLYSGALGIYIGGHQYVDVPNRPGFVYVRLRNNTSELIQAHNEVVSPVYGLPVILVRNKTYYEIYGRDSVQYASYWDSSSSYLPKHGHQHEFDPDNNGGGDLVFVHGEQFYPMMTFPSGTDGGNTVLIAPYRYYYSSAWHYAGDTGAGNLLQYGPTGASNAKLLLVGIDATTGNPFVKLGSEFDASITGAAAMTSYVPTNITQSTEIPGAIVRLVTGTSTITWANIYDARQYMGILQAAGGATDFLGLSDTPNSYSGQADKLVVVNSAANALEFRTNTGSFGGGGGTAIWGALAGSQVDDWSLPGFAGASIINAYASGTSSVVLTGLVGGTAGKQITLKNNSGTGTIVLWNNSSSLFQNQFYLPKTYMSLGPGDSISLIYDADYQNWYPLDATLGFSNDLYFKSWATLGLNSGTTNDWNNFNFAENSIIRVMPSGTATLTGILQFNFYPQGQLITLVNIGSFNVTLKNEDSGSTTHARFSLPNDIVLSPKGSIVLIYDGEYSVSTSRWRSLDYSTTGSNSGGGGTTLGLGFYGQDEGVGLGTGTTLNVVGSDISLSISGTVLTLLHSDPTGTPHSFLDLTDTPDSYSGQGSKFVAVKSDASGLEFVNAPAGGGGGGSGLVVYDDNVYKVTGTAISFDTGLSVIVTGSVAYVSSSVVNGSIALGAKIINSTTVTIPNNSNPSDIISFDTVLTDNGGFYNAGNPTRLTFPLDGWYLIVGSIKWDVNSTGQREIFFKYNSITGTTIAVNLWDAVTGLNTRQSLATAHYFMAGDYVVMGVYQNSGGPLDIGGGEIQSPAFGVMALAAPPFDITPEVDNIFSLVSGTLSLDTQLANTIFAGPSSGSPAKPTFRTLTANDIPGGIGGGISGLVAQNEGITLGTGTTINFVGDNIQATISGSVIMVESYQCGTYQRVGQATAINGITGLFWKVPDGIYASGSLAVFNNGLLKYIGIDYTEQLWVSGTYQYMSAPATGTVHWVMYGIPCTTQIQPSTGTTPPASNFAIQDSDSVLLLDSDNVQILDSDG